MYQVVAVVVCKQVYFLNECMAIYCETLKIPINTEY